MQTDDKNNQNIHNALEEDYNLLEEINKNDTEEDNINASNPYKSGLISRFSIIKAYIIEP